MNSKQKPSIEDVNLLMDNHPDAMAISDLKGTIIAINEKLAQIFGKTRDELIGTLGYDNIENEVGKRRRKIIKKVIETKKPMELIDKERGRWWKAIFHPILDDKGTVVKLAYYIHDVTNEKEAEQNLEKKRIELSKISKEYQFMIDNVADVIMQVTLTGKITYITKNCEAYYGYKQNEVIGKKFTKFAPKKEWSKYFFRINQMLSGKKVLTFETTVLHKNGQIIDVDFSGQMVKSNGKSYFHAVMRNISERKKLKDEYRELVNNINEGLFTLDKTGRFTYINKIIQERSGLSEKEFKRIHFFDIVSENYKNISKKNFNKIINGENVNPFAVEYYSKSGEKITVEINSRPIYKDKEIIGIQCLSKDITEEKKSEWALKESEEKLRNVIHHSDNLYYIHDTNQKITYVSPQSKKILGYTSKEMKIKWTEMLTENPMNEIGFKLTTKAITTGLKQDSYILEVIRKDGGKILVKINESPLKDKNGRVIGITGVLTDITELKRAESEIITRKNYLQNVIDSASEIIFTIDSDFKIRTWNKTAEQITGYKKRYVVGKSIKKVELFDNSSEIKEYIKDIQNGKTAILNEISINTIYGITRIFSVIPSYIKDESKNIIESLFVLRDITKEKETFGKIQSGNSYLILESDNNAVIEIFNSLLESKKRGLYIGRITNKELQTIFKKNIPSIIKLTEEKDDQYPTSNNIEEVYQKIKDFIKNKNNTMIIIDRMDYLITNYSFESVMKTLYKINDLIQKQDSILLLNVNPSIINQSQIAILNEDFKKLPSQKISDIQISQEQYEILIHIQNELNNNILVTYGNIGKTFSISKVTAKKRLESLKDSGLIYSRRQGKSKILNITEKGKNLLKHRTII